jgi:hypothetical protein
MFKINSYLQFRDTLDNKPRVLVEGEDYYIKNTGQLLNGNFEWIADLKDCRPLLMVEINGVEWTEGDIAITDGKLKIVYMLEENSVYKMVGRFVDRLWDDNNEGFVYNSQKLGSFFDGPTKYSKLLWNCTEEEGWNKVFELLEIK